MEPLSDGYDHQRREEIIPYVPAAAQTVLDVGCAGGAFGRALMEVRPGTVVDGMEVEPDAAAPAGRAYRAVVVGAFPDEHPPDRYDAIVCNDVLEHMIDPWSTVAAMRPFLRPGGVVVASIPNMRHWSALQPLLRGRWDYQDHGILDRTHLRWFTKATMAELFVDAGYTIETLETLTASHPQRWSWWLARRLAPRLVDDVLTKQYVVVARLAS